MVMVMEAGGRHGSYCLLVRVRGGLLFLLFQLWYLVEFRRRFGGTSTSLQFVCPSGRPGKNCFHSHGQRMIVSTMK